MTNNNILIIDIETTGFMYQQAAIVEVGIASLNLETSQREIVFYSVCREPHFSARHRTSPMGWIFNNSTLTVEEVVAATLLSDLLPEIQNTVDAHPLGVTAYNRSFDFDFLESRGLRLDKKLPCPMKLSTPICKLPALHRSHGRYKWPKVEEAWQHFFPGVDYIEQHRGADDAMHEALIVLELYRMGVFLTEEENTGELFLPMDRD